MENTVYYFTGTGNSLAIAKNIGKVINNCNIVSIAKNISNVNELQPKGIVGFVFPVFYCGIPKIVKAFLENINLSEAYYVYVIAVYGADLGNAGCIHQIKI
jgi:flavodoxin